MIITVMIITNVDVNLMKLMKLMKLMVGYDTFAFESLGTLWGW